MAAKKDSGGKKAAVPKKKGRPPKYDNAEIVAKIADLYFEEKGLPEIAAELKLLYGDDAPALYTLQAWFREYYNGEDTDFCHALLRARGKKVRSLVPALFSVLSEMRTNGKNPDITPAQQGSLRDFAVHAEKILSALDPDFNEKKSVELTGADGKDLIPAPGLPPEQMNELAVRIAKVREETRRKKMEAAGDE